jgi:hypothetical protein
MAFRSIPLMLVSGLYSILLSRFSVGSRNNEELPVSHLLFADGTLILCDANSEQLPHLRYISYILKLF